MSWVRDRLVARILPRVLASPRLRAFAFGFVSELRIRYRPSPAIIEGYPRLRGGPRAGARLPDAEVWHDGKATSLQRAVAGPHFSLLLCGDSAIWDSSTLATLDARCGGFLRIHRLAKGTRPAAPGVNDHVLALLGAEDGAQYLVRPDGYIAFRCSGSDLSGVLEYLNEWFPESSAAA